MRILFDSKVQYYKDPFGTLTPGQSCTLRIRIPASVVTSFVECLISDERGIPVHSARMTLQETVEPYQVFSGSFQLAPAAISMLKLSPEVFLISDQRSMMSNSSQTR